MEKPDDSNDLFALLICHHCDELCGSRVPEWAEANSETHLFNHFSLVHEGIKLSALNTLY